MSSLNFNELKQREIYKQAKHIKYIDIDGNEVKEVKAIKIAPILLVDSRDDGDVTVKLDICNTMPEGFKVLNGATTAPVGFCWIYNVKSIFSEARKKALLRL